MKRIKPIQWMWFFIAFASWSLSMGLMITDTITPFSNLWLIAGVGYFMFGALE